MKYVSMFVAGQKYNNKFDPIEISVQLFTIGINSIISNEKNNGVPNTYASHSVVVIKLQ